MKKSAKKTIMVVEDDMPTIDVYKTAFGIAGFNIEIASWGEEAIKMLKEAAKAGKKPDLVLLDLILPDMNGLQILKEIRKDEKLKDLSVFILTNYTSQELTKMGYDLDAERYLTKTDYPPSRLISLIKERIK